MADTPGREALNPKTAPARLKELAGQSPALARDVAKNPAAPPELLRRLSQSGDRETVSAVARNPNTPPTLIVRLAECFPREILENPVFAFLLLENPNLLSEVPQSTLRGMLAAENVPAGFVEWAARSPEAPLRAAAAKNPSAAPAVLFELAKDDSAEIRQAVAENPSAPPALLARLACSDLKPAVRRSAAQNPRTPRDILELLCRAGSAPDLSKRDSPPDPALEPEAISELATRGPWAAIVVAMNEHTPPALLAQMGAGEARYLYWMVARNKSTPPQTLERLADDGDEAVRKSVAENLSTPPGVLARLARDESKWVREMVAKHPGAPEESISALVQDREPVVRKMVAKHPGAPEALLRALAQDPEPDVQAAARANPRLR